MIAVALSAILAMGVLSVTGELSRDPPRVGRGVGDRHPPIVLPSLDGKRTLALSQFAGKKVLLIQFASW